MDVLRSQDPPSAYDTLTRGSQVLLFGFNDYVALVLSLLGLVSYLSYGKIWAKPDPYLYKLYERPQEQLGVASESTGPKDIAQQLQGLNKDAVIFWGSQSGTAERFAHRLARDCAQRFGLNVVVGDLSDYDHETISLIPDTKFAIFVVSTYGEGDPSDNTAEFLDWLKKRRGTLSSLRYAAFGLGNSNYVYYNKVVDDIVRCFDELAATPLLPVGKADDADNTTEEDFISWKDDLFLTFHNKLQLEEHVPHYEPSVVVTEITAQAGAHPQSGEPIPLKLSRKAARDYSAIKKLPVKDIKTIVASSSADRTCLHLEVDIRENPQIKYKTGDHLAIWPTNSAEEVRRMLTVLDLVHKQDTEVMISTHEANNDKIKIPGHSTIAALFEHYLEICAPVSRDTIFGLSQLAPTQTTKEFLQDLGKKSAYATFVAQNHITFARLLEHTLLHDTSANWSHLPLSFVIESLRPMTPRYYSISSSSMTSSRQISITVAISATQLAANPMVTIPGLATSYLSSIGGTSSPSVYAHVRRSTFRMPFLHKTPIVLVAAGTGIAPFRAFLQERAQMAQISNQEIGPVLLVFGCRNPEQDYLYKAELEVLQAGPLKGKFEIVTAFSRVPGQKKCYVQDRLAEEEVQSRVRRMLCDDEATLYFCGSTTMAKAAGKAITSTVKQYQGQDDAESKAWADSMKRSRRWQEDVWG